MFYCMEPKHHHEHGAYLEFERKAFHDHLNSTAAQPIIAIMSVDRQLDIVAAMGTNHGTKGYDSDEVCIKRLDGAVVNYSFNDDLRYIAGYDQLRAYLTPRAENWRLGPDSPSALTSAVGMLDAAIKLEVELDVDIHAELSALWGATQVVLRKIALSSESFSDEVTALLSVVNDTELSQKLEAFMAKQLDVYDDIGGLSSSKPLVVSYISAVTGVNSSLSEQVAVLQRLIDSREDLNKSTN